MASSWRARSPRRSATSSAWPNSSRRWPKKPQPSCAPCVRACLHRLRPHALTTRCSSTLLSIHGEICGGGQCRAHGGRPPERRLTELRRFACAELAPRYNERAARSEFCWAAHRQLAELGVLGLGLPEKFGGTGEPDPITLGLATEALAYGDVNVAAAPVQVGLVAAQLAGQARDAVAERYVPA